MVIDAKYCIDVPANILSYGSWISLAKIGFLLCRVPHIKKKNHIGISFWPRYASGKKNIECKDWRRMPNAKDQPHFGEQFWEKGCLGAAKESDSKSKHGSKLLEKASQIAFSVFCFLWRSPRSPAPPPRDYPRNQQNQHPMTASLFF